VTSDGEGTSESPERNAKPAPCIRCGGEMALVTVVGKFGDQPSFKLFRCMTCDFVEWVTA
jgi:hypothetical protein